MAPLFKEASLLPKIANVLEVLEQLEESEATLKLAAAVGVPDLTPELRNLLDLTDVLNPDPNHDQDPVPFPFPNLNQVELNQISRTFEARADRHLKSARQLLKQDYVLLLKILLVAEGVSTINPKFPSSEIDDKILDLFGKCLMVEDDEVDAGGKKDSAKNAPPKQKKRARVARNMNAEDLEGSGSGVADWLRARGEVIGKHATVCIDRTLGFGTDFMFCQGLNKVTGGRIKALLEETRGLQDALKDSCKVNGVDGDGEAQS
ncbi:hypothetical protein RchiOBHm_Chr4g0428621 [Rosa chinensis]|uniref:Uncharacterized protein n=1 Tax=Rosa chinensis TaxID=74649 RepID=A0A2P6QZY8_ROSCH|nr:uncharacterized protein LOC112196208 [Rosa chinensis]PRQ39748.1 hypothetical protein RchiOBHm_Chr4g0428621 [Rosa chinensis]